MRDEFQFPVCRCFGSTGMEFTALWQPVVQNDLCSMVLVPVLTGIKLSALTCIRWDGWSGSENVACLPFLFYVSLVGKGCFVGTYMLLRQRWTLHLSTSERTL